MAALLSLPSHIASALKPNLVSVIVLRLPVSPVPSLRSESIALSQIVIASSRPANDESPDSDAVGAAADASLYSFLSLADAMKLVLLGVVGQRGSIQVNPAERQLLQLEADAFVWTKQHVGTADSWYSLRWIGMSLDGTKVLVAGLPKRDDGATMIAAVLTLPTDTAGANDAALLFQLDRAIASHLSGDGGSGPSVR
mmetsp:Transcript_4116/g.13404  ORF Transcript_4116/g.13404 Transcript_4116/m.13404 type:complete len:197 (-) Transcript_4116:99-689(-)